MFRSCSSHVHLESILSMDQRVHQVTLDVSFKNGQGYLFLCVVVTEIPIVQLWFCMFRFDGFVYLTWISGQHVVIMDLFVSSTIT
jgi:hypothetical protein